MSSQIPSLGDKTDLRDIFRTLENQTSAIFNGDHDAHSASITTCLKKLAQLISSDKKKSEHSEDLHLFSFKTPKVSANHIIICFWDYISWVINKKRLKDYSFSKINSKEFHLTIVPLFPVKLVKDEMSSIVM